MPFHHILFATDFSDASNCALDTAIDLAAAFRAKLTVVHVCELPAYSYANGMMYVPAPEIVQDIRADTDRQLAVVKQRIAARGVAAETVRLEGEARHEIPRYAEAHGNDGIVVGSHGRRGFRRFVLGSVAEHVVRDAKVPVLVVHAEPERASVAGAA